MQELQKSQFAFVKKSVIQIAQILEPKVTGVDVLHDVLQQDNLDFFVSFSSTAGQIPSFMRGMSDYSMANVYLDYFSQYHSKQNTKTTYKTLAWAGWSETDSHSVDNEIGNSPENNANRQGLYFNSNALGQLLFEYAMLDAGENASVLPCVLDEKVFSGCQKKFLFARLEVLSSKVSLPAAVSQSQVESSAPSLSIDGLTARLQDELAKILKVDRDLINPTDNFQDYGLDSISGTQLSMALEKYTGKEIQPRWLIEYPTSVRLAKKILEDQ